MPKQLGLAQVRVQSQEDNSVFLRVAGSQLLGSVICHCCGVWICKRLVLGVEWAWNPGMGIPSRGLTTKPDASYFTYLPFVVGWFTWHNILKAHLYSTWNTFHLNAKQYSTCLCSTLSLSTHLLMAIQVASASWLR